MTPAVSVILPVHNRTYTLAASICSVLDQSMPNFELIVVDDASSDGSAAAARSFRDDRIRVLELDRNGGPSAARNAGIRVALAPLVCFLDSDDSYLPEKLQWVTAEFDRRPGLDLLVDSFTKVQPSGKRVDRRNPVLDDRDRFRKALFTRRLWKATPAITVRRDVILRAGLFDESLRWLEDFDLLVRVSEFASVASTDALLWVKYWDANAISGGEKMIDANLELVRRHPCYLTDPDYRPGLAYIVRLALWRRIRRGHVARAATDARELANAFGAREAVRLLMGATVARRSAQ